MSNRNFALPQFSLRFIPIWRRNLLVWKKMAASSILGHLADPVIYMLGLGYGLGGMLPQMGGTVLYGIPGRRNGVLQHHEQRQFRGAVFRLLRACTNSAPGRRSSTRRSRWTTSCSSEIVWAASKSLLSGAGGAGW